MSAQSRELIRQRLHALHQQGKGILTPQAVVEDAKAKDSPLHGEFTWSLKKAAYERWLDQARTLIRTVYLEVTEDQVNLRVPEYIRNPDAEAKEPGYVRLVSLRSDVDASRAAVISEFIRAGAALRRAKDIAKVLAVDDLIDDVIVRIEDARTYIQQESKV